MSYLGSVPSTGTPFSNNKIQVLSGNGSNTQFTLDYRVNGKADIEVIVNNIQQNPFDGSYEVSNNNILTFSGAPSSGSNNIHIYFRGYSHNVSVPEANSINSNQLTPTGVVADTYGNTTAIPVITVDSAGRITSATTNSVSGVTGVSWTTANNTLTVSTSTVAYSANVSQFSNPVTVSNTLTTKAIVPDANVTHDIGTTLMRYKDLYLANSTIYIGTSTVSETAGALQIASGGNPAVNLATITQATNLAANAYSNAVSTASADATTKAATAYSNATSYADTVAATAFSNAATRAASAYTNAVAYAASNTYVNNTFAQLTETRAVSVSNTLAAGNTTVTGFANVTGSLLVGGVATITGNLVVNGTTITVNTSQINTTDSLMYLASNNEVSDSIDIGFAGHYNNGAGANGHTGLIRSAVSKKYYLFQNYQPEFFANNTVDVANVATGIQMADLVVGNLVANSTLTVTGAATFSNTTAHTGAATFSNTTTHTGAATFSNTIAVTGSTTLSSTLAAGNTTITGFANVSQAVYSGAPSSTTGALYLFSAGNDTRCDLYNGNTEFKIAATYLSTGGYKPINFYTSDAVSATIAANGNFGIGNTTPADKLSVAGRGMFSGGVGIGAGATSGALDLRTGSRTIQLRTTPTGSYYGSALFMSGDVGQTERAWMIATHYNGGGITDLAFEYSSNDTSYGSDVSTLTYAEKFRMASNGNFGVGTNAPTYKLHVNAGVAFIGNSSIAATPTSTYNGYRLEFDSSYDNDPVTGSTVANKIRLHQQPGWVGGFGISADQLNYHSGNHHVFYTSANTSTYGTKVSTINSSGILPGANNTYDLGSSSMVWRHMYTGDLFLSNEGHEEGNDVDGTKGKWTIQEGAEDLFIINRSNGKKYRFKLEEM